MAEITAQMVKDLRERSGLPMMDCKQALAEVGGDMEKAMELLRKRGAAAAEKKAGRATSEGRIGSYLDTQKGVAAIVEMLCESAPVSNNPMFKELSDKIARQAALSGVVDAEALRTSKLVDEPDKTVNDLIHDTVNVIRENMVLGRITRVEASKPAVYVHFNGKVGVVLAAEGAGADEATLRDICMHIAFTNPMAVTREQVPADVVAKEKEITEEQVKASGKPAAILEKIVAGKMDRWFAERVLVEQPFVKDDKKTVGEVLKGIGANVISFARLQVGVA
ncbi:MAG TPA: translation elongation factor Ts [Phycisphaerae bacterium]|jgi:elongation factor Ts|nr:translation elongation factor Ts [Phycisphaerae bacterium]HOB75106.1 translation elongation factor Ts [Phycisphaerae bacterium]HOJ53177.1 translation elongation factor Ts [Phycisphaerae bacterium]HOL25141.1 translation elongation factor Ts [Phycisphaerae bacterium]HPP19683.1 translation elongation factor Ts [Phycisphaerae bacterium]